MTKFTRFNLRSDVNPSKRKGLLRNLKPPYNEKDYDGAGTTKQEEPTPPRHCLMTGMLKSWLRDSQPGRGMLLSCW
ncbi:MAG: hypothetical protein ABR985_07655 [Methanotrichaceae archaeon]|jgi:hypothetical protein